MMDISLVNDGFRLGSWHVEPRLGRMVRDQVVVMLRPRVTEALVVLAEHAGEVVSKRDLVDAVWSSGFVSDNTVVHCINELRNALGDSAKFPQYLQTIPRRGYRLLGDVRRIEATTETRALDGARFQLEGRRWAAFLIDGENLIGRGGQAKIIPPSVRVSRHHARITISAQGAVIEDLGSKNGTFISGRRVLESTPIEDGEEIRIADVTLVFGRRIFDGFDETVSMEGA